MAKDPAFLFYYQDFLEGTDHMTDEQIGQYVKCLCHQAARYTIREYHMKNICKTHDNHMIVKENFKLDDNGELFNLRLRFEMDRRAAYSESRRKNRDPNYICGTYDSHMETETENIIKNKKDKKKTFNFDTIWNKYPKKLGKQEALGYFNMTVKTDKDYANIEKAINNYIHYIGVNGFEDKYIKSGCNWFKEWQEWIDYKEKKQKRIGREALDKMDEWKKEKNL